MANPFVSVINLGCRVNRVESDRMERELARAGLALVDPDDAELIVINTCAVTGEAEAKTRKAVRHALGRARHPFVLATGCAAALHPESLCEISDRVLVEPSKVDVARRARSRPSGTRPARRSAHPRSMPLWVSSRCAGRARA